MLSIAIPTLNEEFHIENMLKSLLLQTVDEPIEVVVADANSSDKTREVVRSYEKHFHRVLIVPGGLPAVGRNNAAKNSRGDLIFFVDADVTFPSKTFLRDVSAYMRKRRIDVAAATLRPRSTRLIDRAFVATSNMIMKATKRFNPSGSMCIVVTRTVFEKSGGYPEQVHMSEDHDFVRSCAQHGSYDVLPHHVDFSVRRLEKEGRWGLAYKYAKVTAYRTFVGPITKPIVEYHFSYSDSESKA